jgi:KaiC/GvpD/RAD55 family RecA-like ATPase
MVLGRLKKSGTSNKFATGLTTFDQITGGGLPKPSALALVGSADGGKEVLARQIVWHLLQQGTKVLYYSLSQSADDLRYDMLSYHWDVRPYEAEGLLRIVDVFSEAMQRMSTEFTSDVDVTELGKLSFHKQVYNLRLIYDEGMRFFPVLPTKSINRVVIFDSVSPLFSTNTKGVFPMIHTLKFASRLANVAGICIMHSDVHDSQTEETFKSIADGIIEVNRSKGTRYIRITKYPQDHARGPFPFEVSNDQVKIIPFVMPELNLG